MFDKRRGLAKVSNQRSLAVGYSRAAGLPSMAWVSWEKEVLAELTVLWIKLSWGRSLHIQTLYVRACAAIYGWDLTYKGFRLRSCFSGSVIIGSIRNENWRQQPIFNSPRRFIGDCASDVLVSITMKTRCLIEVYCKHKPLRNYIFYWANNSQRGERWSLVERRSVIEGRWVNPTFRRFET